MAGEKVLGIKKRKKEEWIQGKTWEKIETRRGAKQQISLTQSEHVRDQLRGEYSELDREVKKMTKLDKRKFVERQAEEAKEAAGRQDLKTLYRINQVLNNGFRHRWQCSFKRSRKTCLLEGHFENILNRPEPEKVVEIPPAAEDLDICIDPPTMEEVKAAIKAMKSGKACGADGVTA